MREIKTRVEIVQRMNLLIVKVFSAFKIIVLNLSIHKIILLIGDIVFSRFTDIR